MDWFCVGWEGKWVSSLGWLVFWGLSVSEDKVVIFRDEEDGVV